jgi:hypothetical protein
MKATNPATKGETSEAMFKEIINKSKITAITTDPDMKKLVVASSLLGQNGGAILAVKGVGLASNFLASSNAPEGTLKTPVPTIVGNQEAEKDVTSFLSSSIKKINMGAFRENEKAQGEAVNSVNTLLTQMGDAAKTGKLDPAKMDSLAVFLADPEYGKFASQGKLNKAATEIGKAAYVKTYEQAVIQEVHSKLETFSKPTPGSTISVRPFNEMVDVTFTGSGIQFIPKNVTFKDKPRKDLLDSSEKFQQHSKVAELNSAAAGVNRLVHIGAHLEGHTDYAKYWEERKYDILPQVYPARAGVIVNGYKSKGGVGSDPSNWEKVQ